MSSSNNQDTTLSPKRPYFLRAMHEWLTENNFTPYLMVDTTNEQVIAPKGYDTNGRLVLAISYQATKDLFIDNQAISFASRFGGVSHDIWVPMTAVIGIYAKENPEEGLFFDPSEYDNYTPKTDDTPPAPPKNGGHLKFV